MRIAVISDIHGNIFALQAVIKKIKQYRVDRVFVLGDFTGYYYHPKLVYQKLLELNATIILGNHEELLFDCLDGKIKIEQLNIKYGSGHKIAINQFSSSEIEEIRELPNYHFENFSGTSIAFYHGSPFDKNYYLYPDSDRDILAKCVSKVDFTFVGHSHYPFITQLSHGLLINVGSIGQSRKLGGVANWCLLNLANNTIEMQATPYDIKPILELVNEYDPDISYLSVILKRGMNDE
jgi:putative phosphoesterase